MKDVAAVVVARGAELLDRELGPGWELKLDFEILNMAACEACVLGQLFDKEYTEALRRLDVDAGEYGFDLGDEMGLVSRQMGNMVDDRELAWDELRSADAGMYLDLEEAWLAEVKRRLEEGVSI